MSETTTPAYLAHWVVTTARAPEMIDWYGHLFDAHVVHEDDQIAFLTWDEESHRLAFDQAAASGEVRVPAGQVPPQGLRRGPSRLHLDSLATLLAKWEQLSKIGIESVWAINHGPTTSLYYEHPDGIRLEFQVESFPTARETANYFGSQQFRGQPDRRQHRPWIPAGTTADRGSGARAAQAGRRHPSGHDPEG